MNTDKPLDPDRRLKDALFECLRAGLLRKSYGGVLAGPDGEKAWINFEIVSAEESKARVAEQAGQ